jgi:CO/xanthine dehydrogenase FAD-binding subunit
MENAPLRKAVTEKYPNSGLFRPPELTRSGMHNAVRQRYRFAPSTSAIAIKRCQSRLELMALHLGAVHHDSWADQRPQQEAGQ